MKLKKTKDKVISVISLSKRAYKDYTGQIIILVVLGLVSGILEGIGINAVIPLVSTLIGDGQATDVISQFIKSLFDFFHIPFSFYYLLLFIILAFVFKAVVTLILKFINFHITYEYENTIRQQLYNSIVNADWEYITKQNSGYLETILLVDVPASASMLQQISTFITIATGLLMYFLFAINISAEITILTIVVGIIIFFGFKRIINLFRNLSYKRVSKNKEASHIVSQSIYGMKSIKVFGAVKPITQRINRMFDYIKDLSISISFYKSLVPVIIQPIAVIFVSIIFALSYSFNMFQLGSLIALVYLIQKIFTYIQQSQSAIQNLNQYVPHLRSVLEYQDSAQAVSEDVSGKQSFSFEKDIKLENVSFSYSNNKGKQINNITFDINKGEMIGVVGPSGAGKTTLVDILLRLLNPQKGDILVDGQSMADISLDEWRNSIGYVSQDVFLINDTIANNISFHADLSHKDIQAAAKKANIDDYIKSLPQGYDTEVGDRGVKLSAGQRQRIAIARVLARQPQVIILDEATSALDNESEIKIQKAIHDLKGNVTVIAIAHRLQTVKDADKLIVLDKGKISESGSPDKLLKDKDSYFFKVYNIREQ